MTNVHPDVCVVYLLRPGADGAGDEVLLGRKLRGLGEGNLVGVGGKLHPGERPVDAAVREVAEEVGVVVATGDLIEMATLDYRFPHRPAWSQRSTAFVCRVFAGVPTASDELDPGWFPVDAIPFDAMWHDARFWLPRVLAGERLDARFDFAADDATVAAEVIRPR